MSVRLTPKEAAAAETFKAFPVSSAANQVTCPGTATRAVRERKRATSVERQATWRRTVPTQMAPVSGPRAAEGVAETATFVTSVDLQTTSCSSVRSTNKGTTTTFLSPSVTFAPRKDTWLETAPKKDLVVVVVPTELDAMAVDPLHTSSKTALSVTARKVSWELLGVNVSLPSLDVSVVSGCGSCLWMWQLSLECVSCLLNVSVVS